MNELAAAAGVMVMMMVVVKNLRQHISYSRAVAAAFKLIQLVAT